MAHERSSYCVVLTIAAPYKAAFDIVIPLDPGDAKDVAAALGQDAFDGLMAHPTETGGRTAIMSGAAIRERLRTREAKDLISQIDGYATRRAMKHLAGDIGDDGREVVLARYERPPFGGYKPNEEVPRTLTPTPWSGRV